MAPPSPLAIATGSVQRLVKEETSYHKELKNQEARLEKLVNSTEENENKEYQLKQEVYHSSSYLTLPYIFHNWSKGMVELIGCFGIESSNRRNESRFPTPPPTHHGRPGETWGEA